ncbi:MAG: lytic murein transglycosylase [Gammaproteobacteria bacterium]|nr:lytic murein transglycosylase [Gammaproteobacteria bacterium]
MLSSAQPYLKHKTILLIFDNFNIWLSKMRLGFISFIVLCSEVWAFSPNAYLEKFEQYRYWSSHIPPQYQPQLAAFIQQPGPLATRLRDKWLGYLGEKQNWPLLAQYWRPSNSTTINCYAAYAYWQQHQRHKAMQIATPIWLQPFSQAKACELIFHELTHEPQWRSKYWAKRIKLALDDRQILLARQLLAHGNSLDQKAAEGFWKIHAFPEAYQRLAHGPWYGEQVLYALKQMIILKRRNANIEKHYLNAVKYAYLNHDQQQRFTAFMTLYLAMRNDAKNQYWFNLLEPRYYNPSLLEWQMRYALLHQQWQKLKTAILRLPRPYTPEMRYWLAKAEQHIGQHESANRRLKLLAKERHYYGFLASQELKMSLAFQAQAPCTNHQLLIPYQKLLSEIRQAYQQKYLGKAHGLLVDFISELPKNQQCTLVDWVEKSLNWPNEAIYLSNQPHLFNQVDLRFPVNHYAQINLQAKYNQLNPAFIYAVIRQESAFHPEIVSPVGAKGLMQLMPRTANLISKRYNISYHQEKELFNPNKNIQLGSKYLADLSKTLQHPLLVAAAYNAGPQAVHHWLKQYPAPDIVTWIDTLPWKETRNYLKNIVAFHAIYEYRLHQQISLQHILKPLPYQVACRVSDS